MAVTIGDVASHANVSRSTVSYVLSGKRSISPETVERVQRSIEELGFRPHAGARSVRARRSGVIGLSLPMVHGRRNSVQMPHVWAVLAAAQEMNLKVLALVDDDGETAVRDAVGSAMVDGVILMEVQRHDPRIALLKELRCPAVIAGSPDDPTGLSQVDYDFDAAAQMAVEHLQSLGHRNIGYLGHPSAVFERSLAYVAHARDAVLRHVRDRCGRPAAWSACESTPDGALESVKGLLSQDPDLTALIVYNERALPLVVHHLGTLGHRIPQDISVVGMGYDDEAEHCVPPCTSVTLSADSIARAAVNGLAQLIRGEQLPARVDLPPTLTVRASTDS
ncbi:LacI family DNA-binding transcriptional regulator [Kutzneria sp. NPDC052558]|uniref:LacI family DNA-binding transcriptional regulator n=1 Tax=Kutzneria sp. NPDC052558 TaxID=3364121 RepID=UPI0037C6380D